MRILKYQSFINRGRCFRLDLATFGDSLLETLSIWPHLWRLQLMCHPGMLLSQQRCVGVHLAVNALNNPWVCIDIFIYLFISILCAR